MKTKEFLSQAGIQYTVKDVVADEQAMAELQKLGVMTTPVTVFGDQVIVGFDQVKLARLIFVVKKED